MAAISKRNLLMAAVASSLLFAGAAAQAQPVQGVFGARAQYTNADGTGANVTTTTPLPVTVMPTSGGGATHAQSSALAASLVAKASAGTLFSFTVSADTTLNASQWYVMVFDATSLPADGAVTPAKCYAVPAGTSVFGGTFNAGGSAFATGIVIGVSTTGCFSKTASTHALFIGADYQ